jgi:hypothetical protein
MAETNAPPTDAQVLLVRDDVKDYMPEGRTLGSYISQSLAECKRILEDGRGVKWSQVFDSTNDAYLDNSDATGRNQDRIQNAVSHMAIGMVFRDYSVKQDLEESWTLHADYHENMASDRLLSSVLDVDVDESGAIDEDEESNIGQSFMVK